MNGGAFLPQKVADLSSPAGPAGSRFQRREPKAPFWASPARVGEPKPWLWETRVGLLRWEATLACPEPALGPAKVAVGAPRLAFLPPQASLWETRERFSPAKSTLLPPFARAGRPKFQPEPSPRGKTNKLKLNPSKTYL